jgi:4,5-DOPA dioxygenase extradiol
MAFYQNNNSIFYISHGGGPLPLLNDAFFNNMNEFLQKKPDLIQEPEAIIISAHWEELTI